MSLLNKFLVSGFVFSIASLPARGQTQNPAVSEWSKTLSAHVAKFKTYPQQSKRRGEQGRVIIRFTIDAGGKVLDVGLTKRTCFEDLNEEAVNMVKRAEPFPPFPETMKLEKKTFGIPMNYRLAGQGPSEEPIDQRAIDACFSP